MAEVTQKMVNNITSAQNNLHYHHVMFLLHSSRCDVCRMRRVKPETEDVSTSITETARVGREYLANGPPDDVKVQQSLTKETHTHTQQCVIQH